MAKTITIEGINCVVTAKDEQIPRIAIDIGLASIIGFLKTLNSCDFKKLIYYPLRNDLEKDS